MFKYFIITVVVVVVGFAGSSNNQKVVICATCKSTAIGLRTGFKFHASPRQAFIRRQKFMQY